MKLFLLSAALILGSFLGWSQPELVRLHPVVGDTVDQSEKIAYLLFSEFPDSVFRAGWLERAGEGYNLHVVALTDTTCLRLDTLQFAQYRMHVEKLSVWYASKEGNTEPVDQPSMIVSEKREKLSYKLSSEVLARIRKEASHYSALSHQADMQGLTGRAREDYINTGGSIEIRIDGERK